MATSKPTWCAPHLLAFPPSQVEAVTVYDGKACCDICLHELYDLDMKERAKIERMRRKRDVESRPNA